MPNLEDIINKVFCDYDILVDDVPKIDLYMDQILTLFNEGLQDSKRFEEDKLLTKTMINNYSKEKLLMPVKGKKYSHEHIMQMLCIYILKQNFLLSDIKSLTDSSDINYQDTYSKFLEIKDKIRDTIPHQLIDGLNTDLSNKNDVLALALALSAISTYMRRICQEIIDTAHSE